MERKYYTHGDFRNHGYKGMLLQNTLKKIDKINVLIKEVLADSEEKTQADLKPIESEIKGLSARQAVLRQEQDKKKPEEITQEEKDDLRKCGEDIQAENKKKNDILAAYAKDNDRVHQLIDLALLQNGMLKGEALTKFVKRSVEMIK